MRQRPNLIPQSIFRIRRTEIPIAEKSGKGAFINFTKSVQQFIQVEVDPLIQKFIREKIEYVQQGDYIQGQDKCPICEGVVNYRYSAYEGFLEFECSDNDCLPWPAGGAKKRRIRGLEKIIPERYRNKTKNG